jgi:probable phosphoglycerate mutase
VADGVIVVVRHGETEWSATGKHTGRTDIPLTDRGRRQAQALRTTLQRWTFAAGLTSPLARAAETAHLCGVTATVDEDLQEWDYGDLEGRTTPEIRVDEPGWTVWRGPIPGGEALAEVSMRVDRVLERLARIEGDVAVFSHGHLLRVLAARWMGLDPVEGARLVLDTATLSILGTEHGARAIHLWNGLPGIAVD